MTTFRLEQLGDLRARLGDQVHIGPYLGTYYYAIKLDKQPWSDPKVRRAISLAIDRDFLAEKVWGNSMFPAYSMVPPGIGGYTPYEADYAGFDQLAREDEAVAILAELGYGPENPLKVELRIYNSDNNQATPSLSRSSFTSLASKRRSSTPMSARTTESWRTVAISISDSAAGLPTTRILRRSSVSRGGQAATTSRTTPMMNMSG